MYKIQLINESTCEVLREHVYKRKDNIVGLIESFEGLNGQECIVFDEERRTLSAEYISYTLGIDNGMKVYRIYLKVKLSEMQVPIRG